MISGRTIWAVGLIVGSGLVWQITQAQQSGISRAELLRRDLSGSGRELIQVRVDFDRGAAFGKHTHPGDEVAFVLEGSLEYQIEGGAVATLGTGESLFIPAGTIHAARNVGNGKASELATYIVEKGKPLATPAPVR